MRAIVKSPTLNFNPPPKGIQPKQGILHRSVSLWVLDPAAGVWFFELRKTQNILIDNPPTPWYFCVNQNYGIGTYSGKAFKSKAARKIDGYKMLG